TAGAADSPPVCGILVVALRVVAVIVGSIDARHPSSHIVRVLGKSVAFLDATALCRGVAAGERENPFVSWVSAAVNVNTTKAYESISPRLRERTKELRGYESICFLGAEVGGAWSCCLPCAGGGGGGGGVDVSGATPETKKSSLLKHQYQQPHQQQRSQQHEHQQQQKVLQQEKQYLYQPPKRICVAQFKERAPLGDLDEDLDDLDDEEKECELRIGEEEDYGREGTQHRLSPRLHDIEEEDDEEGRHIRERPYQPKKSPTPSGSRSGWRSRRSITTAGAPGGHQHHVIATAAATAQARMQAEQGSIGELRGYHNLRSRRHTLANVR
ncbi:hypothetical protein ALC53_13873, partial [Atta colombica]